MKRKHVKKYPYLYRFFPLFFWRKCDDCKKDFIREWGYRAIVGPFCGGRGRSVYLCKSCRSSIQEAHRYFLYVHHRPFRPPAPTPTPPKKDDSVNRV